MDRFIYTLPQEWYEDPNVAIKWKIYATINGFWVNKRPVFASNDFFERKLGVSKRSIQDALAELEKAGLISREIKGLERLILPGGVRPSLIEARGPASPTYEAQPHHNSISNSSNLHTSNGVPLQVVEITTEEEERPRRTKKDTSYKVIFQLFGKYPAFWDKSTTIIQSAKNILAERGVEDAKEALAFARKHQGEEFFPIVTNPWELDTKWDKLVALSLKN